MQKVQRPFVSNKRFSAKRHACIMLTKITKELLVFFFFFENNTYLFLCFLHVIEREVKLNVNSDHCGWVLV